MTLVELLIVIVLIGVLISSVMVASTVLIGKSKARNTQGVLQLVSDAVEQFKRTETERPFFTRNEKYKKRYGQYPPDELEVFSDKPPPPPPNNAVPTKLATPTGSVIVPVPPYQSMKFYNDSDCADATCQSTEHRDLAALIVAIECQGGEAAAILDRISDRNRSAGVLATDGKPAQFLSRPEGINATTVDAEWDAEDLQIRYILDDWGNPIGYMSQRDHVEANEEATKSSNFAAWNEASTEMITLNRGQPILFSYGANGKEQLTKEMMDPNAKGSLIGDFEFNEDHVVNEPVNDDNVYASEEMRAKLSKGIAE